MPARNGEKFGFNRDRKQKIARRKCIYDLLGRRAKEVNPTLHVQPKSVSV